MLKNLKSYQYKTKIQQATWTYIINFMATKEEKDETKERATQGRNHAPARWRRGGTHWFSSTGINDDDFKFAKAVKKAAAKASATDEL